MTRQEIESKLSPHKAELRDMGVDSLFLFGSHLAGKADGQSDVDLLVEFREPVSLFQFFKVQHRLEEILRVDKVDLVERGALHPALRDDVFREAVGVA